MMTVILREQVQYYLSPTLPPPLRDGTPGLGPVSSGVSGLKLEYSKALLSIFSRKKAIPCEVKIIKIYINGFHYLKYFLKAVLKATF